MRSINLQKAIQQKAASANAKDEMKKAKKQGSEDIKGTDLFGVLLITQANDAARADALFPRSFKGNLLKDLPDFALTLRA